MREKKASFKIKVLLPILAIFIVSDLVISFINYRLLDSSVETKTKANMEIFADSILAEIRHLNIILDATKQTLNEKHIAIAKTVIDILENTPGQMSTEKLLQIAQPLDIIELSVVNSNGIITASSVSKYIGFDYKLYEPTSVYMKLTDGTLTEISEEPRASVLNDDVGDLILGDINHYTGIARKNGGFIQIGFNAGVIGRLQEEINIYKTIKETKIGQNGFGMVLSNGFITAHPNGDTSAGILSADKMPDVSRKDWYKTVSFGNGFAWLNIAGKQYYTGYKNEDGNTVVALVPEQDFYMEDDFVARYGGEEFAVVLPNTDENGAQLVAERMLEKMRECNIPHKASYAAAYVTISIGGTTNVIIHLQQGSDYIKAADKALYESKKNGRNRYTSMKILTEKAG